jgi:predicted MFS family arabinose efflux permease
VNRNEWVFLVAERLIDFIRIHISAVGGLNMARKVAACCEFFNVRTAWHGPGNVSPIGHAVNMHLDLASYKIVPPEVRGEYVALRNAASQLGIAAVATASATAFDAGGFDAVSWIAAIATLPFLCVVCG